MLLASCGLLVSLLPGVQCEMMWWKRIISDPYAAGDSRALATLQVRGYLLLRSELALRSALGLFPCGPRSLASCECVLLCECGSCTYILVRTRGLFR